MEIFNFIIIMLFAALIAFLVIGFNKQMAERNKEREERYQKRKEKKDE